MSHPLQVAQQAVAAPGMLATCVAVSAVLVSAGLSRYRYGSWAWGMVLGVAAVAAWAATGWLQVWAAPGSSSPWAPASSGVLAGFVAIGWAGLVQAVGRRFAAAPIRHTDGPWRHRRLMVGGWLTLGLTLTLAGALASHDVTAPGLDRRPVMVLPGLAVVMLLGFGTARLLVGTPGRPPLGGWTLLATMIGYGVFIAGCLQAPPIALVTSRCGSWREPLLRGAIRRWMRLVFLLTPRVRWRMDGATAWLSERGIVVANHESMLDILAVCALPGSRTLLAKRWVFRAALVGMAARAAGIRISDVVDPGATTPTAPVPRPPEREGLLIFPEGHRSRDGQLGRFHLGAFAAAVESGGSVLPVVIAGTAGVLPLGSLWIHPGEIRCQVLPPVSHWTGESLRDFAERTRQLMAQAMIQERASAMISPRLRCHRREALLGLPPRWRMAAADEEAVVPALIAAAPGGTWLVLGVGWSGAVLALRQLAPAIRLIAIADGMVPCTVAAATWWRPGDELGTTLPAHLPAIDGILDLDQDRPDGRGSTSGDTLTSLLDILDTAVLRVVVTPSSSAAAGAVRQRWPRSDDQRCGAFSVLRVQSGDPPAPVAELARPSSMHPPAGPPPCA